MECVLGDRRAGRRRGHDRHWFDERLRRRWLLRDVQLSILVAQAVWKLLPHPVGNLTEIDEAVGDVD
jgi:hypothetical protein